MPPPKTPRPATPIAKIPKRFVPTYHGESNAFCIQLFCIDESYEMRYYLITNVYCIAKLQD